jgi:hypothetical protein
MGQAVQNDPGYPSLIEIVNLWRQKVNDPKGEIIQTPLINQSTGAVITTSVSDVTDPVQGEIVTGEVTICATCLASAVRTVIRKMRNISSQQVLFDNLCFFNLPVINSPTYGSGAADSSVQVTLGTTGFFDGVSMNGNFLLPGTVMNITEVWERLSNSNDSFHKLNKAENGLSGVGQSAFSMGSWEVRGNILYMNGCTQNLDIRLRGWMNIPTLAFSQSVDYTQTYVPIFDSTDCVAAYCVLFYDQQQGSGSPESMQQVELDKAATEDALMDLRINQVRAMQGKSYNRKAYGGESQDWSNFGQ